MKCLIALVLALLVAGMVDAAPQTPPAGSTSGARPHTTIPDHVVHPLGTSDQTTYYAAPFYHDACYMGNCGPFDSVSTAVDTWWSEYKAYWSSYFPGCYYTPTIYPDGASTGDFEHMELGGTCGGSSSVFGTAHSYNPNKNNGCPGSCGGVGDPINLGTGNEYEHQEDYSAPGALKFERYYNSSPAIATTHIGAHWRDNFDRSIEYLTDGTTSTATVFRPDGKEYTFQKVNGTWTSDPDVHDTLIENDDGSGNLTGWNYFVAATQQIETYNASGLLTSIQDLSGLTTTLAYSDASTPSSIAPAPGLLITVTGPRGRQLNFTYNASSQITQVTLPDGGTLACAYDASGNLTQVTYPDGYARAYKYDESGNAPSGFPNLLTGIIDEIGNRYADIHYDSQGRAISSQLGGIANLVQVAYNSGTTSVTWPLGVQSTIGFAIPYGRMRVSSSSQPCGPSCNQTAASRTYDANGNPASSTDFNGNTTAYTYDDAGLETQRIEAQGTSVQRSILTLWDDVLRNPLRRTVLDASGNLTGSADYWSYNARGQVTAKCIVPSGVRMTSCALMHNTRRIRRWGYSYCDAVGGQCPLIGLLLSVDGPRVGVSDVTQYAYYLSTDESGCGAPGGACHHLGDLWKVTDALGHVTRYASYDKDGRPTEIIDPNGVATTFTYTPRGWLHTRSVAGATTTIDYDAVGDVTKVTQPDGVFTTYAYDTAHRLTSIGDASGNHVDFTLDEAGNRTAENTYASGSATPSRSLSRVYNTLGELVKALDAYGQTTQYGYDANGNRTDTTDPLGVKTHEGYDALNRLSQTVQNYLGGDPATANTTTSFGYDSRDNLTEVIDPDGLSTNYSYDNLNDLGQLLSPDTGTTHYTYDAAGNRASRTDARGVTATYTYDALNRLTSIGYPTASLNVHYSYDQTNGTTGCASSSPIGRLTQMADSTGTTTYCYDAHGNVIRKRQVVAGNTYTTIYTWNAADRLTGIVYPDGASVTYTRDADGRIASVSATPVGSINTTIVSAINYLPFGPATGYSFAGGSQALVKLYDANYRVTDIEGSALNLHFKRNAVGDITAEGNTAGVPTPNESYVYDPLDRLQQVDDATGAPWQAYTYDKTGDRLSKATAGQSPPDTYSYQSGTHRLTGISGYDTSNRAFDANGNTTSFQANGWTYGLGFNDANRLTAVQQDGTTIATYGLNGLGERVERTLAGGGTQMYAYDEAGHLLGEYATGQSRDYVWAGGTLVAILDSPAQGGDTIHYVYTDSLGTPRAVTATNGTLVWDWPYTQNPYGEASASGNGYTLNLRFPGQYYDQETGLNYNYFRDYEPGTGRYIESDPLGLAGGLGTYVYVMDHPINRIDPRGLTNWVLQLGGGGYAGIGGEGAIGIYVTTSTTFPYIDIGAYGTVGAGGGQMIGGGIQVGAIRGNESDINGINWNVGGAFAPIGGEAMFSNGSLTGFVIGPSAEEGGEVSASRTWAFGLNDFGRWISNKAFDWHHNDCN